MGVAVGIVVVAAVSPCRLHAAVQGNDQIIASSGDSPRPESLSAAWAEDNVRVVQEKLREAGLYFGEIDGAYSSELAAALGRYQIRYGLPITGQLDEHTSKALGAKAAVTATADDRARRSETWRRLRTGEQQTPNNARARRPRLVRNYRQRVLRPRKAVRLPVTRRFRLKRSPLVHRRRNVRLRI